MACVGFALPTTMDTYVDVRDEPARKDRGEVST